MLRVHEDRGYPGAIVAGLSIPWGDTTNNPGGYHLVWPRDAVETGFAFLALGHLDDAARLLTYLTGQQQVGGHWVQNFFPDGAPFWQGTQLDETALPVMLAAKLADLGYSTDPGIAAMIAAAIGFLVRNGPLTEQDRWEEDPGDSPYTLGVIVAALVAGAAYLSGPDQQYVLDLADDWNHRIEEWTYVHDSWLDSIYGASGHYVRVGPDPQTGVTRIANQAETNFDPPSSGVIGLEYLYLPRLGLRDPNDPRISDTTALVDVLLARNVGTGVAYYRYNYDGYGEQVDGGNWSGVGVGRAWPLLAGERGHGAVLGCAGARSSASSKRPPPFRPARPAESVGQGVDWRRAGKLVPEWQDKLHSGVDVVVLVGKSGRDRPTRASRHHDHQNLKLVGVALLLEEADEVGPRDAEGSADVRDPWLGVDFPAHRLLGDDDATSGHGEADDERVCRVAAAAASHESGMGREDLARCTLDCLVEWDEQRFLGFGPGVDLVVAP